MGVPENNVCNGCYRREQADPPYSILYGHGKQSLLLYLVPYEVKKNSETG